MKRGVFIFVLCMVLIVPILAWAPPGGNQGGGGRTETGYLHFYPSDFTPASPGVYWEITSSYFRSDNAFAPVHLPDGAVVNSITLKFLYGCIHESPYMGVVLGGMPIADPHPLNEIQLTSFLEPRDPLNCENPTILYAGDASGPPPSINPLYNTIDNSAYTYFLELTNASTYHGYYFINATIEYTIGR